MILGVAQDWILGPLLLNIYIKDLFCIINETKICNYAADTTLLDCNKSLNDLMINLEQDSSTAWFMYNYMKLNEEKCQFLLSGHKHEHIWSEIGEAKMWEKSHIKLLGINIDNDLSFNKHVSSIFAKTSYKVNALIRLSTLLNERQRRRIFKAFLD